MIGWKKANILSRDRFVRLVKFMLGFEGISAFAFSLIAWLISSVVMVFAILLVTTIGESLGVLAGLLAAGVLLSTGWRLFPLLFIASLRVLDVMWNTFWVYRMIGAPQNYFRSEILAFYKFNEGEEK